MEKGKLERANTLIEEIDRLKQFIYAAEKVWTGKIIKTKYIIKSNSYGNFNSQEYEMNTRIKNNVLEVLRKELQELELEFKKL